MECKGFFYYSILFCYIKILSWSEDLISRKKADKPCFDDNADSQNLANRIIEYKILKDRAYKIAINQ